MHFACEVERHFCLQGKVQIRNFQVLRASACRTAQVFDLAHNKAEPVSTQKIVGKAALTRLAFNSHHPIIVVGDDKYDFHLLTEFRLIMFNGNMCFRLCHESNYSQVGVYAGAAYIASSYRPTCVRLRVPLESMTLVLHAWTPLWMWP